LEKHQPPSQLLPTENTVQFFTVSQNNSKAQKRDYPFTAFRSGTGRLLIPLCTAAGCRWPTCVL